MNDGSPPAGTPPPPGGYGPQALGAPAPAPGPSPFHAQAPWPAAPVVFQPATHGLAVLSFAASVALCVPGSAIAAIVCGILARNAIRREPQRYTGDTLALVGIAIGGVQIGLGVLYAVVMLGAMILAAVTHG